MISFLLHTHITHTHTHIYIYIYIGLVTTKVLRDFKEYSDRKVDRLLKHYINIFD